MMVPEEGLVPAGTIFIPMTPNLNLTGLDTTSPSNGEIKNNLLSS